MTLLDPLDQRPLHFMGVGGAGMSALALIARRRGVPVTGCDQDISGVADLRAVGVEVWSGHDPAHVRGSRGVVFTAAVPRAHEELAAATAEGVPVIPRKRALADLVSGGTVVAVAGTHGKTTTTVMTTEALAAAGIDPTGLAGGRVPAWGGNARVGGDRVFVVEADEYDQAFLELSPTIAIVNNVEPDHLECYGSMPALEAAFDEFARRATRVLVGVDDAGARRVADQLGARAWRFGVHGEELKLSNVRQSPEHTTAALRLPDGRQVTVRLQVPGLHNLRNATAAIGAVVALGAPVERALEALADFTGVGRRFERLGEIGGVALVDDYAHHPSELVATLAAARQAFPGRRLVAVFQPHLYSRTELHAEAMGVALAVADVVVVSEIYAAREQPIPGVSGRQVADAAKRSGARVFFEPDRAALGQRVFGLVRPGDVVLTLGAGDITRVGGELAAWLRAA